MKTIGVVGSRRRVSREDREYLFAALRERLEPDDRLVSGGCSTGADAWAEMYAQQEQVTITIHYAKWKGPAGKAAGFVRNSFIAEDCDILIAVVAEDRTGGTEDTIKKAKRLGKQIILL